MNKKPVLFVTIADDTNLKYAKALETSFKKFHKDIPFHIVQGEELKSYLEDPMFFYRSTPILGEKLLEEYELVVKIDSDSLVLGDLSYIWKTTDYDIGTVINWNRIDPKTYGLVQGWGILPTEYFNCGLVAMRSKKFAHDWNVWCHSPQFDRLQFKEQDGLNALCYHGNWNVRCFDHLDPIAGMNAWWGLVSKGEWNRAIVKDNKIIVPKGDDNFPNQDIELKVIHMAGGSGGKKDNWGAYFSDDVMKKINSLTR